MTAALDVVRRLRAAGYETYFAGGCVRDRLLGGAPGGGAAALPAHGARGRAVRRRARAARRRTLRGGDLPLRRRLRRRPTPEPRPLRLGARGRRAARLHDQRAVLGSARG